MAERVLLIIDHLHVGGAQRHVLELAELLRQRGHDVLLGYTGNATWPAPVDAVQLLPTPVERSISAQLHDRVHAVAKDWSPSVIHAHLFSSIAAAASSGSRLGIPVVATHHSAGTWQTPSERQRFMVLLRVVARHLAVSPQIAASLVSAGLHADRVEYVPNAVALPPYAAPARHTDGLRVGFLGRLCADKDPVTAVRALAAARSITNVDVTLRMAGDGDLRADVVREIRRLALGPHLELRGEILDVAAFMRDVDVLLLSSRSEGTPLVVLEAMGHGRPVVATRVGGIPDQVEDGVTGRLAAAGDALGLGQALAWIAERPEVRRAMGWASRQRLADNFSLDRLVGQVEGTYARASLDHRLSLAETATS